jgi:hypothetical protein
VYRILDGPKGHSKSRGLYFFLWKRKENRQLRKAFSVHHLIVAAITRVEFVNDRLSYVVLRGRWYNNIVLNVHATSEEKMTIKKTDFMRK